MACIQKIVAFAALMAVSSMAQTCPEFMSTQDNLVAWALENSCTDQTLQDSYAEKKAQGEACPEECETACFRNVLKTPAADYAACAADNDFAQAFATLEAGCQCGGSNAAATSVFATVAAAAAVAAL